MWFRGSRISTAATTQQPPRAPLTSAIALPLSLRTTTRLQSYAVLRGRGADRSMLHLFISEFLSQPVLETLGLPLPQVHAVMPEMHDVRYVAPIIFIGHMVWFIESKSKCGTYYCDMNCILSGLLSSPCSGRGPCHVNVVVFLVQMLLFNSLSFGIFRSWWEVILHKETGKELQLHYLLFWLSAPWLSPLLYSWHQVFITFNSFLVFLFLFLV